MERTTHSLLLTPLLYHNLGDLSRGFFETLNFFYSQLLRTVPCLIAPAQAFYQRKWHLATHPLGSNSSLPLLTPLLYHNLGGLSRGFLELSKNFLINSDFCRQLGTFGISTFSGGLTSTPS